MSPDQQHRHLAARAAARSQIFVADLNHPVATADDDHHLTRVLRLRSGEAVVAADGRGRFRLCRYQGLGQPLEFDGDVIEDPPVGEPVTVAFAPVKGDRPEWAFAKLVELGADTICLLVTDRSVIRWGEERAEKQRLRLDKIALAAAAQCRRTTLPALVGPMTLAEAADAIDGLTVADIGGAPPAAALRAVAVGPEGGWSDQERALGLPTVSLGSTVLRAETAAVAAGTLCQWLRDGSVTPPQ